MVRYRYLVLSVTLLGILSVVPAASPSQPPAEAPLPDLEHFKAEVRKRLDPDRDVMSQYTYMERREEIDVSGLGKVQKGPVKVYEVYPSEEPGNTWKRLISIDGKPLSATELDKNDRINREHIVARQNESPGERAKREREDARDLAETRAAIDELFRLYTITVVGREHLGGNPVIAVRLDPKPDYRPRTKEGQWMRKMRLRAWIHETDYEVVRAEADVLDDVKVGWGLVGRIHKGATGRLDRTKVNGEVWLPKRAVVQATGRTLVFRTFTVAATTEWWNYRRRDSGG